MITRRGAFCRKEKRYTRLPMRVHVILPAAGIGTRMAGTAAPKQFLTIGGVPILIHSLRAFASVSSISTILVAVRAGEMERVAIQIADYGLSDRVQVVEGGDSRQHSVANGLAALQADPGDPVLVHDAVRPMIAPATIERTIEAIQHTGAAIVALPAVDTIKQVERTAAGAIITATIPRELIVLAQTPQGARFEWMQKAFAEAAKDDFNGTDEASLLERAGIQVAVVAGSPRNFKITQPGDLELAEFYLSQAGRATS